MELDGEVTALVETVAALVTVTEAEGESVCGAVGMPRALVDTSGETDAATLEETE